MGILDFDAVFDILDPARLGYMTVDQIREFDTTLHFTPLIKPQVEAAIRHVCGVKSAGCVNKVHFMKVPTGSVSLLYPVSLQIQFIIV